MRTATKAQQRREIRYRQQLKACGFRSWKRANKRRFELIKEKVESGVESDELRQLQILCDMYASWKTNDALGRSMQRLKRLEKRCKLKLKN